ncbi:MAG TPA: hypothetical protein VNO14_01075, partial [Blastocatellia bacterium]|nr:hypothetical protein [Blastocatellia bacterium]
MYRSFLPKRPSRLFAKLLSLISINLVILSASIPAPAQGFGRLKMYIDLHSYTPPRILLEGTNILIQVTAQASVSQHFLDRLKKGLEDLVPAADPRLRPVSYNPETIIYCEITELNSSSRQEIRTQSVYKKIGEHTEYDETTKMNRTVEHYGYVDETYHVTIVDGLLSALYECIDVNTGDLIDSDTITARFHKEYTFESPGSGEVEYYMMRNVISNIGDRFIADVGTYRLLLPKGKLKGTSEMLQKMMWNSALEKLSAMRPLKDPEDDAFRLYSIAIACHGLSGSTRDLESNRYYMEKAVSYYREAARKNPREDAFRQAQTLAEESLANYRRVETLLASYEAKRRQ